MTRLFTFLLIPVLFFGCCHPKSNTLEPKIYYSPQKRHVSRLPHPFPPLTKEEENTRWGEELQIAYTFANDLDLYRAITGMKRAKALLPKEKQERLLQTNYSILLCYYLGCKWCDVIETFETSALKYVPEDFPAFRNLMIILYDSYQKIGECEKASAILELLSNYDEEATSKLHLYSAIQNGNLQKINSSPRSDLVRNWMNGYCSCAKSPKKAQTLNALLPGAGYLYVEQPQSALTAFLLNGLFIAASWRFFDRGHVAAGIVTASFEAGWYFGGINGAGLMAKSYNERLYNDSAREVLLQERLFPVLMFNYGF